MMLFSKPPAAAAEDGWVYERASKKAPPDTHRLRASTKRTDGQPQELQSLLGGGLYHNGLAADAGLEHLDKWGHSAALAEGEQGPRGATVTLGPASDHPRVTLSDSEESFRAVAKRWLGTEVATHTEVWT